MPDWCLHTAYSALRQHTPHHISPYRQTAGGESDVVGGNSGWVSLVSPPSLAPSHTRAGPSLVVLRAVSLSPVWPARKSSDLRPVLPSYHCYSLTLLLWRLTVFYPGWLQHSLSSSLVSAVTQDESGRLITSVSIK